jgi:hypothetical protein
LAKRPLTGLTGLTGKQQAKGKTGADTATEKTFDKICRIKSLDPGGIEALMDLRGRFREGFSKQVPGIPVLEHPQFGHSSAGKRDPSAEPSLLHSWPPIFCRSL